MIPSDRYSTNVYWYPGDEAYVALCPEFPVLSALGDTPEEAVAELRIAVAATVDAYREMGAELPVPSFAPEPKPPSGEFRLRLPKDLHARLAHMAQREGVSQNTLVVSYVARGLGGQGAATLAPVDLNRLAEAVAERVVHALSGSEGRGRAVRG